MLKRHLAYDAELDRHDKAEEMRVAYEARVEEKGKEGNKVEEQLMAPAAVGGDEDGEEISSSATSFFDRTPRLKAQNPVIAGQ